MANVLINGKVHELEDQVNLGRLLAALSLPAQRIAVEVNNSVVRRADWPTTAINPGDKIEIVHFVGGG